MSTDKWYGAGGRFRNKIYVGNLSSRTKESDIRTAFSECGPVSDIILKYDFAFVEMENERDIQPAIDALDQYESNGRKWVVEQARRGSSRSGGGGGGYGHGNGHNGPRSYHDHNPYDDRYSRFPSRGGPRFGSNRYGSRGRDHMNGGRENMHRRPAGMRPARGDYRLQILGLSSATSWQDLKDWARKAGESVCYGDVFIDCGRRMGIIEYSSKDDYLYAINKLNGQKLHGKTLKVYKDGQVPTNDDDTSAHDNHDGSMDDMDSNKSSPRLHDNERHNSRRNYYGHNRERSGHGHGHKSKHRHRRDRDRDRHRDRERGHRSRRNRRSASGSRSSSRGRLSSHSRSRSRSRSRSQSRSRSRSRGKHSRRRSRRDRTNDRRRRGRSRSGSGSASSSKSNKHSQSRSRSKSGSVEKKDNNNKEKKDGNGDNNVKVTEIGKSNDMDVDKQRDGEIESNKDKDDNNKSKDNENENENEITDNNGSSKKDNLDKSQSRSRSPSR